MIGDLEVLQALQNDWRGDATRGGFALFGTLLLLSLYHSARRIEGYAALFAVLPFAGALVGAFAVVLASAFAGVWATIIRRGAPGPQIYSVVTIGLLALSVGVVWVLADVSDTRPRTYILFMVVLPLVSAVYDYLSFGLTRRRIRLGRRRRSACTILYGAGDLFAAGIFFVALGFTLIAVITLMNSVAATPLVDLEATLIDIRVNRGRYWWL